MTDQKFNTYHTEIPADLVKRIKHVCADLDMSMKEYIESAIEWYTQSMELQNAAFKSKVA